MADLRSRTQEITAEYWAARDTQSERVAVAQLVLALARAEGERNTLADQLQGWYYRRHSTFSEYGEAGVVAARQLRWALDDAENDLARGGGQQETGG